MKSPLLALFIHNLIDWNIEDPKGKSIEKVREIRDIIESRVKELGEMKIIKTLH